MQSVISILYILMHAARLKVTASKYNPLKWLTLQKKPSFELELAHQRTDANCIHQKENSPKPINHCLTLKEEPKVKSDHIERFLAHDFL